MVGGLGILVAVLVRCEGQVNGVPTLLPLVLAAVSGAMFPSIAMPTLASSSRRTTGRCRAFSPVTALHGDLFDILPNLGALLAIALGTFAIAVWRFRHT